MPGARGMQLRTIFNRLQKFKGFVYEKINWSLGLEQASPNEGKLQKHENLQLFPVFLD